MPITVRVRDAMDNKAYSIDASRSVMDVVKTMLERSVWSLVIEKNGLPVGVVTERDIIRCCTARGLDPARAKIEDVDRSPFITVEPDAPVGQAMKLMVEKAVRRVYVVEGGKIIGRLSQTRVLDEMLNVILAISGLQYEA